jgi:ABC-type dipeptide/oligopeptide/nickel transport system permease component
MRSAWSRNRWWVTRVLAMPVHLAVFAIATFFLVRLIPGDPVIRVIGEERRDQITPEQYLAVQKGLGLDGTLIEQFFRYFGRLFTGNLGTSLTDGTSVATAVGTRFPATVELALMGVGLALVVVFAASMLATLRPKNPVSIVIRGYAKTAGAIPSYILAVFALFVFYASLHISPAPLGRLKSGILPVHPITNMPFLDTILNGRFDATFDMAQHLVLPVLVLVVADSAILLKLLMSGLDEAVHSPQTRFRIASGAKRSAVIASVYRRAAPPAVVMGGALFGSMLGGTVLLENLFGFAAMGAYAVQAVNNGDFVVLQAFLLLMAFISLTVYLVVDLVNMTLDPRRRPGVQAEAA